MLLYILSHLIPYEKLRAGNDHTQQEREVKLREER